MADQPEGRTRKSLLIAAGSATLVAGLAGGCLFAVFGVGILAAIAIPNFVAMQLKAKRAEVPAHVDSIRVAELSYDAAFTGYVAAGTEAEARAAITDGRQARTFTGGGGWDEIGWHPGGPIRGAYWVALTAEGFEVHGISDVDNDGVYAEYVATQDEAPRAITPPEIH